MKNLRINLIKVLSASMLAVFFMMTGLVENCQMIVHAQSHEDETMDTEGPVVNAAISNGKLSVEAYDESGIKAIYVNDYEFTDVQEGSLSIRLQEFDTGYQEFMISALDNCGNKSSDYTIANPYYYADESEDSKNDLPQDANATGITDAKAEVTEYTEVSGDDGSIKVFYTFETENGKTFYLIIDRSEKSEEVHFLTDISENDLLNATSDNVETLPKNSAALNSSLPVTQIPEEEIIVEEVSETQIEIDAESSSIEESEETEVNEDKPMGTYIVLGIAGALAIGLGYYFKVVKKKDTFIDEEDEDDDEMEEIEERDEDNETPNKDDEFFDTEEKGQESDGK